MPPQNNEARLRVLFFGHRYNPISIACLHALLEARAYTITVGIHVAAGTGTRKTVRKLWCTKGPRVVFARVRDVLVAAARIYLRQIKFPLRGFRSLDEMMMVYPCERFVFDRINAPASVEGVRGLHPDVIVVANFSQILKPSIIDIPARGCINVHPSLLPKYRGPNPLYWALHNKETETGVTVHYIDAGIDAGDIILQRQIPIDRGQTELRLQGKAAVAGARLLQAAMCLISEGQVPRMPQRAEDATYYSTAPRGRSLL